MPRKKTIPPVSQKPSEMNITEPAAPQKAGKPRARSAVAGSMTPASMKAAKERKRPGADKVINKPEARQNPENPGSLDSAVSRQEQIALLAYSYWEARGYHGGSPEEDWFRAETEFRNRLEQSAGTRQA